MILRKSSYLNRKINSSPIQEEDDEILNRYEESSKFKLNKKSKKHTTKS